MSYSLAPSSPCASCILLLYSIVVRFRPRILAAFALFPSHLRSASWIKQSFHLADDLFEVQPSHRNVDLRAGDRRVLDAPAGS